MGLADQVQVEATLEYPFGRRDDATRGRYVGLLLWKWLESMEVVNKWYR
jgi:hypothetical protein